MGELSPEQIHFADTLEKTGTFKIGAFRLKLHEKNPDEPLSPYYLSMRLKDMNGETDEEKRRNFDDLRVSFAYAVHSKITDLLREGLFSVKLKAYLAGPRPGGFDYVIGIPQAGEPFAEILSLITYAPILRMEKIEDQSGRKINSAIHGEFNKGQRILGVDDVITAADTKFEFIEGVEANGLKVVSIVVGVDREQGGIQRLQEAGYDIRAALTITQLLDHYLESGKMDQDTYSKLRI